MTILRTVLAGLLLVATASTADARKNMWPPVAKYDSGPLMNARYPKPIIKHLSPTKLIHACQGKHLACSYAEIGSPCEIFLPLVGWEKMIRHEMGHCRGWSADHKS